MKDRFKDNHTPRLFGGALAGRTQDPQGSLLPVQRAPSSSLLPKEGLWPQHVPLQSPAPRPQDAKACELLGGLYPSPA